jgi:hypothetical protein
MATEISNIFIGTELKLNINIEPMGEVTMDDYDWFVEVYCSAKRIVVIKKQDAIRIDDNNYVVLVDSAELGAGELKCKIYAHIPDSDFEDNTRTEVSMISTGINIIKTL